MSWEEHEVRRQEEYRELQPQEVIEDQAAEIKRLEAERGEARALATRRGEIQVNQQAQLATMRAALKKCDDYLTSGTITCSIGTGSMGHEWIRQALATDAGKAAADVLAAAVAWRERTGTLGNLIEKVEAYRNEGRDDG